MPEPWQVDEAGLREMLRARLDGGGIGSSRAPLQVASTPSTAHNKVPSDYDLNPGMREGEGRPKRLRRAAVVVSICFNPEPVILFTQRTKQLKHHGGQISFPGGKVDSGDRNVSDTALRELEEELGIERGHVEPFGFLDCYETRTGFLVAPLVAILKPGFKIRPDPNEVDEVFEVPFAFLMDPSNHRRHGRIFDGHTRYFYAVSYNTRYIWGASAGILVNMQKRLFGR